MRRLKIPLPFFPSTLAFAAIATLAPRGSSQQFGIAPIPTLGSDTEAAKFGDWDLDGDLDMVWANGGDSSTPANGQQSRVLLNQGLAQGGSIGAFFDATATNLLPNFFSSGRDVQPVDIDNDGDLDLYFSNQAQTSDQSNTWFINQGLAQGGTAGVFIRDMSRWVGVGLSGSSVQSGLVLHGGDFSGGWKDWSCQCEFADVDFDGDMDLYHSSYGPGFSATVMSRIFLNGSGTTLGSFREYNPSGQMSGNPGLPAGSAAGFLEGTQTENTTNTTGASHDITNMALDADFADLDGDLDHDVYANSRDTRQRMYQGRWMENGQSLGNEISGTRLFRDITVAWIPTLSDASSNYDGDLNDMDNDGDADGYFLNGGSPTADVYAFNDGTGVFGPLSIAPGSDNDDNEIDWIDFDNDGDVDVFISAFAGSDRLYQNTFVETGSATLSLTSGVITNIGNRTLGADIGDMDNDGDPDIIEAQDGNLNEVMDRNTLNVPDPIAPRVPRLTQLADGGPTSTPRLVVAQAYDNINFEYFEKATGVLNYTVDGDPHVATATYAGGNLWQARIPGYWTGNISYSLSVTDRTGNTGTSATKSFTVSSAGLSSYGSGSPGCNGAQVMSANSGPTINNPDFVLRCSNAPPSSLGLVLLTDVADVGGSDPFGLGFLLHVNLFLSTQLYSLDSNSDPSGLASAPAPLPNVPSAVGASLFAQNLNVWSSCSLPSPIGVSSSNGLQFTFLP